MTLQDLFIWFLDDGCYDKKRGSFILSSLCLNRAENMHLSFHLWRVLGIESKVLHQKVRNKIFWRQRIPSAQFDSLKPEFKTFIVENEIF